MRRVTAIGGLAAVAALAAPGGAGAAVSCEYQQAGAPGPAGNVLAIEASEFEELAAIRRSGATIQVTNDVTGQLVSCSGGTPTVTNLDTISFNGKKEADGLFINLVAGPFAPGATSEGQGSEIEFEFDWKGGQLGLGGTQGNDTFAFGVVPGPGNQVEPALNLNPSSELAKDTDVRLDDLANGIVRLRKGDDVLTARGGPEFAGPLRAGFFTVIGAGGRDAITGGPRSDFLDGGQGADLLRGGGGRDQLSGTGGRDRLIGGAGGDELDGGGSRDRAVGGGGNDRLSLRDGRRDRARCGPGIDRGEADRADRLRGCEAVNRA